MHISRQEFRAELLSGLHNERGIAWGHCLTQLSHNVKSQIELEFQVGEEKYVTQADLVVGADGIRSQVRDFLI